MRIGQAMSDYLWELDAAGGPVTVPDLAERTGRGGFRRGWWYEPAHRLEESGLAFAVYIRPEGKRSHRALVISPLGTGMVAEWRREGYRRPRHSKRKKKSR